VAAANGQMTCTKLLLEFKANVNPRDRWGSTPLDDALAGNHTDVANYIREHGGVAGAGTNRSHGNVVKQDPKSAVAMLLMAAAEGNVSVIRTLLDKGEATVDQTDYDKRSAAHLAASEGRLEVLHLLAERGANFNMADRWGNRCLTDAVRGGNASCAEFLRSKGAEEAPFEVDRKQVALKNASPEVMAELHRRGVREFWALDSDDFEMEAQPFAKGAGGEIFRARWRDLDCVAKTCGRLTTTEQSLSDLGNEISLMATIRHPNIILFFGACFQVSPPVILLEYCALGNLETRMIRAFADGAPTKDRISPAQKYKYAIELARGMTFLHRCTIPIIHRDLKPQNVLISESDTIKITDFGLAKYIPHKNKFLEDKFTMTGETGSYRYMAPEVFRHEPYNQAVDVYSYSLIMFWLFSGVRPFAAISDPVNAVKFAALENGRPPLSVVKDPKVRAILERGWAPRPDDRPSFSHIVRHLEEMKTSVKSVSSEASTRGSGSKRESCAVS